jgi:hypothetical protein
MRRPPHHAVAMRYVGPNPFDCEALRSGAGPDADRLRRRRRAADPPRRARGDRNGSARTGSATRGRPARRTSSGSARTCTSTRRRAARFSRTSTGTSSAGTSRRSRSPASGTRRTSSRSIRRAPRSPIGTRCRRMSRGAADVARHSASTTAKPREFLAIGIPSFGMVHLFFMARMLNLRLPMNTTIRWFYVVGKEVGDARNEIVAQALAREQARPADALQGAVLHRRRRAAASRLPAEAADAPAADRQRACTTRRPASRSRSRCTTRATASRASWRRASCSRSPGTAWAARSSTPTSSAACATSRPRRRPVRLSALVQDDARSRARSARRRQITHNQTEDMYFLDRARALGYQPAVDTSPQTFAWHFDTKRWSATRRSSGRSGTRRAGHLGDRRRAGRLGERRMIARRLLDLRAVQPVDAASTQAPCGKGAPQAMNARSTSIRSRAVRETQIGTAADAFHELFYAALRPGR